MFALGAPAWIAIGGILLFGLLLVLTYALGLARSAKKAAEQISVASARLKTAAEELNVEARRVTEKAERLRRARDRAGG